MEHILCSELPPLPVGDQSLGVWEAAPGASSKWSSCRLRLLEASDNLEDPRDTAYCRAVKFWGQHHGNETK